jgi:ferredoxin-NADP reductase
MSYTVKIKSIKNITHDVLQIVTDKPSGYLFVPGQATDISINKGGWKEEKRAFTFTSLPSDNYLEFTIKTYPSHKGVTNQILQLTENDQLILHEVFGEISYKGEGLFIAGGAGITPFISIFRHLNVADGIGKNKLIFANKTKSDIIHEDEFQKLLGNNFINILSDEKVNGYDHGFITKDFLKSNIQDTNSFLYLCGPPLMMESVEMELSKLGIRKNLIIKEEF